MNKRLQELAKRKEMLQARAALHRLEVQRDWLGLGESLSWLHTGARAAATLSAGTSLVGSTLKRVLGNPATELVALVSGVLMLVRMAAAGVRALRGGRGPSSG